MVLDFRIKSMLKDVSIDAMVAKHSKILNIYNFWDKGEFLKGNSYNILKYK